MAINQEKMKQRLENLNKKGGSNSPFWKPEAGDTLMRFLPSEDEDPFKNFHLHYDLGDTAFLCPKKNFNQKCPACEFAHQLWKEGTDASKKQAKKLFPQERFCTNVLVRGKDGKEDEGPKPYSYGRKTYEQLLKLVMDPDYGDVTDPTEGRDFTLNYKKAETKGAFPVTTLIAKPKNSRIAKTDKQIKEILDKCKDVSIYFLKKSTDEVKAILDESMKDPFDGKEKDDSELEKDFSKGSDEVSSVDEALKELAGEE